ncbi:MAG: hypothetical protein Q4C96_00690 [Planctomycetia bacterium]|nr:hypothetical protein [Planctomycetia bacterium]
MSTALSFDPILSLVVQVLSKLENRFVDYRSLSMAAIVRNGYYIGLSYKSENTLVVWRSGSDSIEFYNRNSGDLIQSVKTDSQMTTEIDSLPTPGMHSSATFV